MEPRSAKQVIDQAIADNRAAEYLLYLFAVLFVVVGLSILVWGLSKGDAVTMIVGAVSSGLFLPAMSSARLTRKESIAIRLLEAPLARAATAREAVDIIRHILDQRLRNNQSDA